MRPIRTTSRAARAEAQADSRRQDESVALLAWRFQRLLGIGIEPDQALRLASQSSVDCHALVALVRRGCPLGLALRIL
jgi:hypothetical protein